MSHVVSIKTSFRDLGALKAACKALSLPCTEGPQKITLFSSKVDCNFSVQLPGWQYSVAINTETGEAQYDNYNGSWGSIDEFNRLHQEYAAQAVELSQDVQQYLQDGYVMQREHQKDGSLRLVLYQT